MRGHSSASATISSWTSAIAEVLRDALDPAGLTERKVCTLKIRRSRQRPEGRPSNWYVWCDAILGSLRLSEAVRAIEA